MQCEHNGPLFCEEYQELPKNVTFRYDGVVMPLSKSVEEAACFYAKRPEKFKDDQTFKDNFFEDWKKLMTNEEKIKISDFNKCNFDNIKKYIEEEKKNKENIDKKNKDKEKNDEKYGKCLIDGKTEIIENYKIEGPGLFEGRGENPNRGKIRMRVEPKDVTINCSKDVTPPVGTKWKKTINKKEFIYLASWTDNVQNVKKYIKLHPDSTFRLNDNREKYKKAQSLNGHIKNIQNDYRKNWGSDDLETKQIAVALYFIDTLLLRAGNEKDKGEDKDEVGTYGCCSLLVKHITLLHNNYIELEFLSKQSIPYKKRVVVEPIVYKNLEQFISKKQPEDKLFDKLSAKKVNAYLETIMNGLTIKVFRTYNASVQFEKFLKQLTSELINPSDNNELKKAHNKASEEVAKLLNHTTDTTTLKSYIDPRITYAWYVY